MRVKSFYEFLSWKINEAEEPAIFKGYGKDPYQYKIEGGKTYYAKKSLGDLPSDSQSWVENKNKRGIKAIKSLYSKISSTSEMTPEDREKVAEIQEALNRAKPIIPKFWALPLSVDGIPGWRTAYVYWVLFYEMPHYENIDDTSEYNKEKFEDFKGILSEEYELLYKTPLEYIEKLFTGDDSLNSLFVKSGKIDWAEVVKYVNAKVDVMLGKLPEGGYRLDFLNCTKYVKSIPSGIKSDSINIYPDSPIKTIPSDITCDELYVASNNKLTVPKINSSSVRIIGPSVLSSDWDQIDYLCITDGDKPCTISAIPSTLKNIGDLYISSETISSLPDNLQIGKILSSYSPDLEIPPEVEASIKRSPEINIEIPKEVIINKKIPWWKRIFHRKKMNESVNRKIYEGYSLKGDLDISGCSKIEKLPVGLNILGNFDITESGIEFNYTDEEIRSQCQIGGQIIRFGGDVSYEF
jgi:hypothetical protein